MDWYRMMFGGAGAGWLDAALLIGLFWAALAHPDRIRSLIGFRVATILLGVSIVVPYVIQLFLVGSPGQRGAGPDPGMAVYGMAISPVITMLAVIFGVDSVTPRSRRTDA